MKGGSSRLIPDSWPRRLNATGSVKVCGFRVASIRMALRASERIYEAHRMSLGVSSAANIDSSLIATN